MKGKNFKKTTNKYSNILIFKVHIPIYSQKIKKQKNKLGQME